jgi:anaerobic selenocysteine-containing dehydrogenase
VTEARTTFCRICEALCGLQVTMAQGRVVDVQPDADHVATGGFACVKGLKQHRIYGSPDRLTHPERRVGDRWERVSWDGALDDIGHRVRRIRAEHGPDAIAMYVGTAAGFGVLHPMFAQGFMQGLGSTSMYSSATQDCANKFAVARHMYGFPFTQPFPDVDRTRCLIVVGANPAISKWSFLQVPNPAKRLRAIEERGGRVFVVDPRRTETAKVAGEHVFIRPNTDVYFYLAFLHELIRTGGVDEPRVREHMTGYDTVRRIVDGWTPERASTVTHIPASKLREMVAAHRQADGAALYCSTGVNMGTHGSLAFWLQECINAVSGNLDRRGGTLVGRGLIDFAKFGKRTGILMREARSRVGGFASVNDAFPGGVLADEILTPGPRQVRALFVTGGNPLLTMPNSGRLREAFQHLDLLVTLDIFKGETASLAHYTLPCTSPLQRPDLPFVFPLMMGLQARPYIQATEAMQEPEGEQRDEATIYLDLARACGAPLWGSRIAQRALAMLRRWHEARGGRGLPEALLLSTLLRAMGGGSFRALLTHPHGRLLPDHRGGDYLGQRVVTGDGRVHLAPPVLVEAAAGLERAFQGELARRGQLKLITRRAITTHNSWTHNLEDMARVGGGTNHLYMHPADAAASGLDEGDLADVSTRVATVRLPVRLLADLMPGTVALPHGWGHQHATGLSVARRTRGVNVNLLAADGPDALEPISGMAHLTGVGVEVRPAEGAQASTWSGMP